MKEVRKLPKTFSGKAVAIYARTAEDNLMGLYRQVTRVTEYVQNKGGERIVVFFDNAESGHSLDRPSLAMLRAAVRNHWVSAVVAQDPERLSRNYTHFAGLIQEILMNDADLYFSAGQINGSELLNVVASAIARYRKECTHDKRAKYD